MSSELERERWEQANQAAQSRCQDQGQWKNYLGALKGAALKVRTLGLLQMVLFWLRKRDDKVDEGTVQLLEDLVAWWRKSKLTTGYCRAGAQNERHEIQYTIQARNGGHLVTALTQRSSRELRLLEAEAIAYLDWLDGTAEALKQEEQKKVKA